MRINDIILSNLTFVSLLQMDFINKIFTPSAVRAIFTDRSTPPIGKDALRNIGLDYHSRESNGSLILIASITTNMSTNDGELTLTVLAAVAQEESSNLSKELIFGKKRMQKMGKHQI
ncbi:MAG TPA: hypothetical protein VIK78_05920 [Ruminiclostridium sp.]